MDTSMKLPDRQALLWKCITVGVGAAVGVAVEQALAASWKLVSRHNPPRDPADRRRPLVEAMLWGAAVGIGAGVARVVANRSASVVWEAATNETPPGVPDA